MSLKIITHHTWLGIQAPQIYNRKLVVWIAGVQVHITSQESGDNRQASKYMYKSDKRNSKVTEIVKKDKNGCCYTLSYPNRHFHPTNRPCLFLGIKMGTSRIKKRKN